MNRRRLRVLCRTGNLNPAIRDTPGRTTLRELIERKMAELRDPQPGGALIIGPLLGHDSQDGFSTPFKRSMGCALWQYGRNGQSDARFTEPLRLVATEQSWGASRSPVLALEIVALNRGAANAPAIKAS